MRAQPTGEEHRLPDRLADRPAAWAFLGVLGLLALAIPNSYVVSAPARGDVPWLAVGGYAIALVASMLFTLSYVRAREY